MGQYPQWSSYFETLNWNFRVYFAEHVRNGIKFMVEATLEDLSHYITAVIVSGRYRNYCELKFLANLAARNRLLECVKFAMDDYVRIGMIKYGLGLDRVSLVYYIPEIVRDHGHFKTIYHRIQEVFRAADKDGTDRQGIINYLKYFDPKFDPATLDAFLNRLLNCNCITQRMVNNRPHYTINFA